MSARPSDVDLHAPASEPADSLAVHEEDLLSLAACAFARERFPELGFADPLAESLLAEITLERAAFDERRLRSSVVRTMVVDALVSDFLDRNPSGLAVALLPGLCTRFSRVDNGAMQWLDLEPPEVAAFKRKLFPMPERHVIAQCCSVSCAGWMKVLGDANDMPILLVAQGGFRRASAELRDAFFTNAAQHLPSGTELVIDDDAAAADPSFVAERQRRARDAGRHRRMGHVSANPVRALRRARGAPRVRPRGCECGVAAVSRPQHAVRRASSLHVNAEGAFLPLMISSDASLISAAGRPCRACSRSPPVCGRCRESR